MIVLDTHIWVWWVHGDARLPRAHREFIEAYEDQGLGVSAISCWEVAKLVERGRLELPRAVGDWFPLAFSYPAMRLLPLTPRIAVESTQLPSPFGRDPADQIIVATARVFQSTLMTIDQKLVAYPHVRKAP